MWLGKRWHSFDVYRMSDLHNQLLEKTDMIMSLNISG